MTKAQQFVSAGGHLYDCIWSFFSAHLLDRLSLVGMWHDCYGIWHTQKMRPWALHCVCVCVMNIWHALSLDGHVCACWTHVCFGVLIWQHRYPHRLKMWWELSIQCDNGIKLINYLNVRHIIAVFFSVWLCCNEGCASIWIWWNIATDCKRFCWVLYVCKGPLFCCVYIFLLFLFFKENYIQSVEI